jgi:hypothetical protein
MYSNVASSSPKEIDPQKSPVVSWAFLPQGFETIEFCMVGLVRFELTTKGL